MRLNQVTLPCQDLTRAIAFYKRLGLKIIVDSPPHYARFVMPQGESTLSLHVTGGKAGGTTVYFECDDLDGTVSRLKAAGISFDSDPVDQTWLWREAHLRDPDGNMICLFHAGENRLDPPWRVKD